MKKIERNQLANIQAAGGCCKTSGSNPASGNTINVTVNTTVSKSTTSSTTPI